MVNGLIASRRPFLTHPFTIHHSPFTRLSPRRYRDQYMGEAPLPALSGSAKHTAYAGQRAGLRESVVPVAEDCRAFFVVAFPARRSSVYLTPGLLRVCR